MEKKISYPIDGTLSDVVNKKCPILHALGIVGQKWKLPILWYLRQLLRLKEVGTCPYPYRSLPDAKFKR